jgi:3'5'-cyclic nucleotide phosphodiesterase/Adenylate and Guanylate cyclase catalytic domain
MTQFARQCLNQMNDLTKQLEVSLGPSTGDLKGRCGLHSGPVTAGVLRGEKARFQLFGDTMNTASRMESAGIPDRIHISRETASLLEEAGKAYWVSSRSEKVVLKGKGELQTFFAFPDQNSDMISSGHTASTSDSPTATLFADQQLTSGVEKCDKTAADQQERRQRLVRWNADVLTLHLADVVVARRQTQYPSQLPHSQPVGAISSHGCSSTPLLPEMTEMIAMPEFSTVRSLDKRCSSDLTTPVKEELHEFVEQIASRYRDVPFHNFEHASHVLMSAGKLMKRIMNPDEVDVSRDSVEVARSVHEKTYGISSDPLMQFAVVFSALIHDVDHTGFTNKELVDSKTAVASLYDERSVAEQHSVDVAWGILMQEKFTSLQRAIFPTEEDQHRFRQLVVNAVMATDIADKELQEWRKCRWETAFNAESVSLMGEKEVADRKATIVFEYIIQSSDVIHCMQHWLTYQKYNARLFEERFLAWLNGTPGARDPAMGWYEGEIWFFDNYIIPLAQKLHECGVFGVSYDESLNYAQQNLLEWKQKGHDIVREMDLRCRTKHKASTARMIKKELDKPCAEQSLRGSGSRLIGRRAGRPK